MFVSEYKFLLMVFYMLPVFLFSRLWFLSSLPDVITRIIFNTATSFNTMGSDTEFYLSQGVYFTATRCGVSCYFSCVSELVWTAREYYGVLAREWETGPKRRWRLTVGIAGCNCWAVQP